MISSILIIGFSVFLFAYWFRYTCLLILSTKTSRDYTQEVAQTNQLSFVDVQKALATGRVDDARALYRSLERDYEVLRYLLVHGTGHGEAEGIIEQRMLMFDYQLMRLWFAIARRLSPGQLAQPLSEMAGIVAHFANQMGARVAARA